VTNPAADLAYRLKVFRQIGLLKPTLPHKLAKMGREFLRWGPSFPAGVGIVAARYPNQPAVIDDAGEITWSELRDRVNQLSHALQERGVGAGDSVGLLALNHRNFIIAMVAIIYVGASRIAARLLDQPPDEVAVRFVPAIVPLGFAWSVTHYLTAFLVDIQNFIALLSDPLGRGWDLFHTIDNIVNYRLLTPTETGWVQVTVLLGGCVLSAFLIHRTALTTYRGRRAVRAMYPLAAVLVAGAVGAVGLLLGT
jgi:hypothetical protein